MENVCLGLNKLFHLQLLGRQATRQSPPSEGPSEGHITCTAKIRALVPILPNTWHLRLQWVTIGDVAGGAEKGRTGIKTRQEVIHFLEHLLYARCCAR